MALLTRARLVVAADTGPLHLAVALGAPVVALFGPTNPRRNGPYSAADVVVQNAALSENTHHRGREFAASMLSISVEQVLAAVAVRLERAR
jgi:heptosyltransferase-1